VSGAPKEDGEFILGRLSEIARADGIPLGGEQCRANLYIVVTAHPAELLRAMDKQRHDFTFGGASAEAIDQFVNSSRPVRVWYHTAVKTPEDTPLQSVMFASIEPFIEDRARFDYARDGARDRPLIRRPEQRCPR